MCLIPDLSNVQDPVTAEDGHVYSRKSIKEWIETCQLGDIPIISPYTRAEMGPTLVDNKDLQQLLNNLNKTISKYKWQSSKTEQEDLYLQQKRVKLTSSDSVNNNDEKRESMKKYPLGTDQEDPGECFQSHSCDSSAPLSLKHLAKLFQALDVDESFHNDILPEWTPPCITVIGNESSGKSTILERLLMMSIFPRGEEICTR